MGLDWPPLNCRTLSGPAKSGSRAARKASSRAASMASAPATSLVPENAAWRSIDGMGFSGVSSGLRAAFVDGGGRNHMTLHVCFAPKATRHVSTRNLTLRVKTGHSPHRGLPDYVPWAKRLDVAPAIMAPGSRPPCMARPDRLSWAYAHHPDHRLRFCRLRCRGAGAGRGQPLPSDQGRWQAAQMLRPPRSTLRERARAAGPEPTGRGYGVGRHR